MKFCHESLSSASQLPQPFVLVTMAALPSYQVTHAWTLAGFSYWRSERMRFHKEHSAQPHVMIAGDIWYLMSESKNVNKIQKNHRASIEGQMKLTNISCWQWALSSPLVKDQQNKKTWKCQNRKKWKNKLLEVLMTRGEMNALKLSMAWGKSDSGGSLLFLNSDLL